MITLKKNQNISSILFFLLLSLASCQADKSSDSGKSTDKNMEQELSTAPFTDLDVAAFEAKMNDDNIVILDVRTPAETAEGMIDGAIEIDFRSPDFAQKISNLDKNKTYLVYCRSGGRSVGACNVMSEQGFSHLYNLLGGYMAWDKK